MTLRTKNHELD